MTYLLSFLVMLIAAAALAVGLIHGKRLRGSCGGLNCRNCKSRDECPKRKEQR